MIRIRSDDSLFSEEKTQSILEESKLTSENEKMYRRKLKNLVGENLERKLSRQPKLTIARDLSYHIAMKEDKDELSHMLD
jgi:hypothetical protein